MIAAAVDWVVALGPYAVIAVGAWALWVATLLSMWTYGAGVFAALVVTSWGWTGSLVVDAVAFALLVGYVVDCMIDPRADCWFCGGAPKRRNARKYFHLCLVCKGSGQRKRWGSKVLARHRESAGDVT